MTGTNRVVYIIDDDPAVRRSLERLLDAADFQAVSFATHKAFLDVAGSLPVGCALIDLRMPEMSGLEVQEQLNLMNPELPVIMVTGQGDVHSAVRAMKAGAVDYMEKPYTDEALIAAIESALKSGVQKTRTDEVAAAVSLINTLSPRERQVLDALVAGRANKAIAFELGLSVRTVEVHRARMMDRLGVRQLGEAVRFAVLAKLVEER
jgi:two-component system, LuxR family, response regulator FixJ